MSQEKLHRILKIEDRLRAEISSYTLEIDVDERWRMTVATHGEFETWDVFKQKFYQRYFPHSVMKRLMREFMDLRQGSEEHVMQYMDIYDYLHQFAGDLVKDESEDVYHFGDGLRSGIGYHVVTTGGRTLIEMYERALAHETYYLGRVADGRAPGLVSSVEQAMEYKRWRQSGNGARGWNIGAQDWGTATHPLALPPVSSITPAHSTIGRRHLPPPIRPGLRAPVVHALLAPQASRQQPQGGTG
ncbi:hypothetical protein Scep_019687 [Stephania cephalantha]|uniref:Retrotransposon gag domain-containing protein n=1 Tax=Stephania cephalantha TaxID=152367 RepID=A0AAP0IBC8_9MAGN